MLFGQDTPYRESKLTQLLIDALAGGKTALVANCSPLKSHAEETSHTLAFASRANAVKAVPVANVNPTDKLIAELRAENNRLREENTKLKELLKSKGIRLPSDMADMENDEGSKEDPRPKSPRCTCFGRKRVSPAQSAHL